MGALSSLPHRWGLIAAIVVVSEGRRNRNKKILDADSAAAD